MAVYIDNADVVLIHRGRVRVWCHLVAVPLSDIDELHRIARKIGLKREWFQDKEVPHYDVVAEKIPKVVKAGALPIRSRELVKKYLPELAEIRRNRLVKSMTARAYR